MYIRMQTASIRVYEDRFLLSGSVTTLLDDAQIYINGCLVEGAYDFGNASGTDTVSQSSAMRFRCMKATTM